MRRGNGFVRLLFGMMLTLVLVLGVCGGVGAGDVKPKTELKFLKEEVKQLRYELDDILDRQRLSDAKMWFERTKEQAETAKNWTETHKIIVDDFYFTLIWISAIAAVLIGLLAIVFQRQQKQIAIESQNELKLQVEQITNNYKTDTDNAKKEFDQKRSEIDELVKKCEDLKDICELNAQKTGKILSKQEQRVKDYNNPQASTAMDDETKEAFRNVASSNPDEIYTHLKAKAISYELREEWDNAVRLWQALNQEFPTNPETNFRLAYSLEKIVNDKNREALLSEANRLYKITTELNSNILHSMAFNNWGWNILQLAKTKPISEKKKDYQEAIRLFKKTAIIHFRTTT